jgi:hypothetical protein
MAERYQDLQRPTLLETGIVQNNAGSAAVRLAQTFKDFEATTGEFAGALNAQRGAREGDEAGASGKPGLRAGVRAITKYGQAYNNAAIRSYAIKSEADADETAARLETEAGTDPEAFRTGFSKVRDEVLKTAERDARPVLAEIYNRRLAGGIERLTIAQAKEIREEQRATTSEGIGRAVDKIARLRASDDPRVIEELAEEEVKLSLMIDGAVNDGTLSLTEGSALRRDADRSIIKQTVTARFAQEFDNPYGDPIGFIEDLRESNKQSNALPPDEEEKLMDGLMAELRERNALRSARKSASDAAQQARFDEGDRVATASLLSGSLTVPALHRMVESGNLEPSVGRTLYNELTAGDTVGGRSDPAELFRTRLTLLELSEDDIRTNRALSFKDRGDLLLQRRELQNTWRGTQQAREAIGRIDRALGIVEGTNTKLLTEEELRARDQALTEFYDKVDGLPPAERQLKAIEMSDEIVKRVIAGNANVEISRWRQRIEFAQQQFQSKKSPSQRETADHNSTIAKWEGNIKQLEAKTK